MSDGPNRTRNLFGAFGFIVVVGVAATIIVSGTNDDPTQSQTTASNSAPPTATTTSANDDTADIQDAIYEQRRELRMPAMSARSSISSLRSLTADALVGNGQEPDELRDRIADRVETIVAAADRLEAAGDNIDATGSQTGEPGVDTAAVRLETLLTRVPDIAEQLRTSATDAQELTDAVITLHVAADNYADAADNTPDSTEVDDLIDDWRDERSRLNDYHARANAATDHAPIADHARAHRTLVEELAGVADDAIADLEDDDLDAYNVRLDGHLDAVDELIDDIEQSLSGALDGAVAPLEHVENRTLGLLVELDQVREEVNVW